MSAFTQFLSDKKVHLILVTASFALIGAISVALTAIQTGALVLPPNIGVLLAPYLPFIGYIVASWRAALGTESDLQQKIEEAVDAAVKAALHEPTA